jgi:hypothetical protein
MTYQLYWGDLHSHCSISYGEGTVRQALLRARDQLDFCSLTGHAFWPDMPTDRDRYGQIIDYHREGFARLARNWDQLIDESRANTVEGEFLVIPSYEWHSLQFGDHNVYAAGPALPLRDAPDLPGLREVARAGNAIVVPHHIGYAAGYRGIDWQHFDSQLSPIVEIHSLHGCSESEQAPYPMLHDMGPRDSGSTAVAGWQAGHRFGVIASTDHHGGYPGSHGDGRAGVFATALTREALWEAITNRRVFAVTGDKISAKLLVDDAWPGSEIRSPGRRNLRIDVRGPAAIDRVEVLKNDRILKRLFPGVVPVNAETRFQLRITWGWGRKDEPVPWQVKLTVSEGEISDVEPCFSGQSIVAPQGVGGHTDSSDEEDQPHQLVDRSPRSLTWRSITTGNRSTRHGTTQALALQLDAPVTANLVVEANSRRIEYPLHELLRQGRSTYLRGWLSEAIRVGPLEPLGDCVVQGDFSDEPEQDCDRYRIRVAQVNGQWAWVSPIWVER